MRSEIRTGRCRRMEFGTGAKLPMDRIVGRLGRCCCRSFLWDQSACLPAAVLELQLTGCTGVDVRGSTQLARPEAAGIPGLERRCWTALKLVWGSGLVKLALTLHGVSVRITEPYCVIIAPHPSRLPTTRPLHTETGSSVIFYWLPHKPCLRRSRRAIPRAYIWETPKPKRLLYPSQSSNGRGRRKLELLAYETDGLVLIFATSRGLLLVIVRTENGFKI